LSLSSFEVKLALPAVRNAQCRGLSNAVG